MIRITLVVLVGLLLSGCQPSDHSPGMHGAAAERQALGDSLNQGYVVLQKAADTLSPDVRRLYQGMQQMHAQGMHGPGAMMNGSPRSMHDEMHEGEMHGGEMHGRGMMEPNAEDRSMTSDSITTGADASSAETSAEWHQQMMALHQSMAQMHADDGRAGWAGRHTQMQRWHEQMMAADRNVASSRQQRSASDDPSPRLDAIDAASLYNRQCATCHGADGGGMQRVYPPLAGSDWVTGDPDRLARILLHGLQGRIEVQGAFYNGVMPAFGQRLSDAELAALMTHLRTAWGNAADSVSAERVRSVRSRYPNRTSPWKAEELNRP